MSSENTDTNSSDRDATSSAVKPTTLSQRLVQAQQQQQQRQQRQQSQLNEEQHERAEESGNVHVKRENNVMIRSFLRMQQLHKSRLWRWCNVVMVATVFLLVCSTLLSELFTTLSSTSAWGDGATVPRYHQVVAVFVRGVGLVFAAAFVSAWVQVHGLIGSSGILPVDDVCAALSILQKQIRQKQVGRLKTVVNLVFFLSQMPVLFTRRFSTDLQLHLHCGLGVVSSLTLFLLPLSWLYPLSLLSFLSCTLLYNSLRIAGQRFFALQWDSLLVETGWLTLAAVAALPFPPLLTTVIVLLRFHIFKLMFLSGWAKLSSGCTMWASLTAMQYHYWTQPLPGPFSRFLHFLPTRYHTVETLGTFVLELLVPVLMLVPAFDFLPATACLLTCTFMLVLFLCGNYGFFHPLTVVLCLPLLSDHHVPSFLHLGSHPLLQPSSWLTALPLLLLSGCIATVFLLTFMVPIAAAPRSILRTPLPAFILRLHSFLSKFNVQNSYGLFARMTVSRPEILIEGRSDASNEWQLYVWKYKPCLESRGCSLIPFHMPRLDWMAWFVALAPPSAPTPDWLLRLLFKLARREPTVQALFDQCPDFVPAQLRITVYDYEFTAPGTAATATYWKRTYRRELVPAFDCQSQAASSSSSSSSSSSCNGNSSSTSAGKTQSKTMSALHSLLSS